MKKSSFIVLRPRGSGFFTKAEEATYLPSKDMESAYIPPEHLRKTPKQDPAKVVRSEIAEYYLSVRCTCLKAVYRSAPSHPERLFVCKSSLIKAIDKETPSQTWAPEYCSRSYLTAKVSAPITTRTTCKTAKAMRMSGRC